jgi:hypothetical protein
MDHQSFIQRFFVIIFGLRLLAWWSGTASKARIVATTIARLVAAPEGRTGIGGTITG